MAEPVKFLLCTAAKCKKFTYHHHIHIPFGQIQIEDLVQFLDSLQTKYMFGYQQCQMKTRHNLQWIYKETNRLPCLQRYQSAIFDPKKWITVSASIQCANSIFRFDFLGCIQLWFRPIKGSFCPKTPLFWPKSAHSIIILVGAHSIRAT